MKSETYETIGLVVRIATPWFMLGGLSLAAMPANVAAVLIVAGLVTAVAVVAGIGLGWVLFRIFG